MLITTVNILGSKQFSTLIISILHQPDRFLACRNNSLELVDLSGIHKASLGDQTIAQESLHKSMDLLAHNSSLNTVKYDSYAKF